MTRNWKLAGVPVCLRRCIYKSEFISSHPPRTTCFNFSTTREKNIGNFAGVVVGVGAVFQINIPTKISAVYILDKKEGIF